MMKSHFLSMVIYAVFVCTILALIRRNELKAQIKYGGILFLIMVVGAILFGWFMSIFIK